jgi:hypothetical protein
MFAPAAPTSAEQAAAPGTSARDYEFIELRNTGTTALDLTGCAFTDGVDFVFPALSLAPGQSTLVVADPVAFAARYGGGLPIAGTFTGALDNSGERIRLEDAVGETVLDFRYEPEWFPPTDGGGRSLVVRTSPPNHATYDIPTHWAISDTPGGTPGSAESGGFAHHYSGWLHDHFTAAEQADPLLSAPSADADGDGNNNLAEYAFGGNPRQPDRTLPATIEHASGPTGDCILIHYPRPTSTLDLTYIVEASNDLAAGLWVAASLPETVAPLSPELQRVTARDADFANTERRFYRVRVVKP